MINREVMRIPGAAHPAGGRVSYPGLNRADRNGNDTSTPGGSGKNPAFTRLELRLEWWAFSVPSRVGLSDDAGEDRTRRLAFHVCRGIDRPWHGDGDRKSGV